METKEGFLIPSMLVRTVNTDYLQSSFNRLYYTLESFYAGETKRRFGEYIYHSSNDTEVEFHFNNNPNLSYLEICLERLLVSKLENPISTYQCMCLRWYANTDILEIIHSKCFEGPGNIPLTENITNTENLTELIQRLKDGTFN